MYGFPENNKLFSGWFPAIAFCGNFFRMIATRVTLCFLRIAFLTIDHVSKMCQQVRRLLLTMYIFTQKDALLNAKKAK